jgi:hypothetical protein
MLVYRKCNTVFSMSFKVQLAVQRGGTSEPNARITLAVSAPSSAVTRKLGRTVVPTLFSVGIP